MSENKKEPRNSSIELLRIISMLGVVILHYNNASIGGGFKYVQDGSINQYFLYFTENLFIGAVNLFLLISAYFLSTSNKRNFVKVFELLLQLFLFRIVFYIVYLIFGYQIFSFKGMFVYLLPANYFIILYSVVYILSPYFNKFLDSLSSEQIKKTTIVLFVLFSVCSIFVDILSNLTGESLNGLSTVGAYGSQHGYSLVNFVLIYFIGAYLKRNEIKLSAKASFIGAAITLLLMYIISIVEHKTEMPSTTTWYYNNPLLIINVVFVFEFFLNLNFKSKVINELAKAAFTCFLLHADFLFSVGVKQFVEKPLPILIVHQFVVAAGLYLVSYVVYKIYTLCTTWFVKLVTPGINKINPFI